MSQRRVPWWLYLLVAGVSALFVFVWVIECWGPDSSGADAEISAGHVRVTSVDPDSPAAAAGLRPGDLVLSIDGQPLRSLWQAEVMLYSSLRIGQPRRLEILRDGRRFTASITIPLYPFSKWPPALKTELASLLSHLLTLLIAVIIAFNRPRDAIALLGAAFLASVTNQFQPYPGSVVIATWRELPRVLQALLWIGQVFSFGVLIFCVAFWTNFPRPLFRSRWPWIAICAPELVRISILARYLYLQLYRPEIAPAELPRWVRVYTGVDIVLYIVPTVVIVVKHYRALHDANEKRRLGLVTLAAAVGFIALTPLFFVVAVGASASSPLAVFETVPARLVAYSLSLPFPLAFGYALLRHRLLDVRVMIRQALQYAIARGALLSIVPVLGVVLLADLLVHGNQPLLEIVKARGWLYAVIGGIAIMAHLRRRKWQESLDRRFFREQYNAQQILRDVADEIRQAASLQQAAPRVVARVESALHAEFAALLVHDPGTAEYRCMASAPAGLAPSALGAASKVVGLVRVLGKPLRVSLGDSTGLMQELPRTDTEFLRQSRIDLLVPIAVAGSGREALLALGIKRSEEPYSHADQELLQAVASSLALLLGNPTGLVGVPGFEECPECGSCYETGFGHCTNEGALLTPVPVPRVLARRYQLEKRLGRGGMGTVYQARDTALERKVAVKMIREDLLHNKEATQRFQREARAAAAFSHPNVVTVHDFGVESGTRAYLVMELLQGATLRQELDARPKMPARQVLGIVRGICAGLEAAHREDLVHRDLKPENIFLTVTGTNETVKILDFGVAKFIPRMTQATVDRETIGILGTPQYMSPEQLKGESVSPAWDVWAVSVMAYEMLTGIHPFGSGNPGTAQFAIVEGRFKPVNEVIPNAPERWQEFFVRAFAVSPEFRPGSASALVAAMEQALSAVNARPA
ncbi:MAG TPA: protein kinase [Terriglobales bacterium]|nr:protein kinase [Terriglobales bacterium]